MRGKVHPVEARALYQASARPVDLARHFGVSRPAITKWLRKWRTEAVSAPPSTLDAPRLDAPQEAVRTLVPAKPVLAEVFGKPVGLCWP